MNKPTAVIVLDFQINGGVFFVHCLSCNHPRGLWHPLETRQRRAVSPPCQSELWSTHSLPFVPVGIDKTENSTVCLVITGCLHYFLMLVFSIMMAEGIELYLQVVKVFTRKSLGWKLFIPTFFLPLCVLGVTGGLTWNTGYRNDDLCWLSGASGALWSLIGTAILVIVTNFVIAVLVIRAMLSTHYTMNQERKDRIKAIVKAICVLTPLLGLSWFFGIVTVFGDSEVFQYCFAVCNTLQGVFVFIFHCLLSKQVRHGYRIKLHVLRAKYMSKFSSSSDGQVKF